MSYYNIPWYVWAFAFWLIMSVVVVAQFYARHLWSEWDDDDCNFH